MYLRSDIGGEFTSHKFTIGFDEEESERKLKETRPTHKHDILDRRNNICSNMRGYF